MHGTFIFSIVVVTMIITPFTTSAKKPYFHGTVSFITIIRLSNVQRTSLCRKDFDGSLAISKFPPEQSQRDQSSIQYLDSSMSLKSFPPPMMKIQQDVRQDPNNILELTTNLASVQRHDNNIYPHLSNQQDNSLKQIHWHRRC